MFAARTVVIFSALPLAAAFVSTAALLVLTNATAVLPVTVAGVRRFGAVIRHHRLSSLPIPLATYQRPTRNSASSSR